MPCEASPDRGRDRREPVLGRLPCSIWLGGSLVLLLALTLPSAAQELLRDINTSTVVRGSDVRGFGGREGRIFFAANLELVVKMVDGRPVNGRFWVFYGSLTDVEYELQITDTERGVTRRFAHAAGEICGGIDTAAFAP